MDALDALMKADRKRLRYEAAKAAMQGLMRDAQVPTRFDTKEDYAWRSALAKRIAKTAVEMGDALLAALEE